jgi:hypothetical protein
VHADNEGNEIPPDKTTGELAAQFLVWLTIFTAKAGVERPNLADGPDLSRFIYLKNARQKATAARSRRRGRSE